MKKIVKLTESDLMNIVKRVIKEEYTEGSDEFIDTIVKKYNISDDLKNEILRSLEQSQCRKISFGNIKGAGGLSLWDGVVINPMNLNFSLGKFLFILFHELAHQYQFKKYGIEKMMEIYNQEMNIMDAGKFMHDVEKVADEFGLKKMNSLKRKGIVDFSNYDVKKGYENSTPQQFVQMIQYFRNELVKNNITDPKKISEFIYNMVKIGEPIKQTETPKEIKKIEEPQVKKEPISQIQKSTEIPSDIETYVGDLHVNDMGDFKNFKVIDGILSLNNVKTIESVEYVKKNLWVKGNKFEDFGSLKKVGGNVIISSTIPFIQNHTEDEIKNMIEIDGNLYIMG